MRSLTAQQDVEMYFFDYLQFLIYICRHSLAKDFGVMDKYLGAIFPIFLQNSFTSFLPSQDTP